MRTSVIIGAIALLIAGSALHAGPVVKVCNGNGSVDVKFAVEYNRPYWNVNKGNTTVHRIFRYDENTRRVMPIGSSNWTFELKNSTPNRLVDRKGNVILEYRNGNISTKNGKNVAVLQGGKLYLGGTVNCIANFRDGNLPLGLALTIAANYYLSKELNFKPVEFKRPVQKKRIAVLAIPNGKAETFFYQGDKKDGKILYTFRNGFIYEGKQTKDDRSKAKYVVSLLKTGGKKNNIAHIIELYDMKVAAKPAFTFVNDDKQALFNEDYLTLAPRIRLSGLGIYVGTSDKKPIACLDRTGSRLYRGDKAEGTPIMTMEGNRYNHWVDMLIWAKILEKDIQAYLEANRDAYTPFHMKKAKK